MVDSADSQLRMEENRNCFHSQQDWRSNEENFAVSNLIEIEDWKVQHDSLSGPSIESRIKLKDEGKRNEKFTTFETSGVGEFCRRGETCRTSPIGL